IGEGRWTLLLGLSRSSAAELTLTERGWMSRVIAPYEKAASAPIEAAPELVPEAGIEPARLSARDFLTTSAFAASACAVRGLEHAFTIALQP
ncbi:MAG: hypothetical protein AB2406_24550, partial [Pseudomonas aeruginosa]